MIDFVIVSTPILNIYYPPPAPAVLKSCLEKHGFTCKAYDLSIKLRNDCQGEYWKSYNEIDKYMQLQLNIRYSNKTLEEILDEKINELTPETQELYLELQAKYAKEILDESPKYIGISVLSVNSLMFTYDLAKTIKRFDKNAKIILGGPGIKEQGHGYFRDNLDFGDFFRKIGLADITVYGEGELPIVEIAKGNLTYPGINNKNSKQILDLTDLPYPNYDDYKDRYGNGESLILSLTGSRGCVRDCAFCDIKSMWNKFVFRTGQHIADEILYQYEKYNVHEFIFTDSLINGSVKEFKALCDVLVRYKEEKKLPDNINLKGQFICRPKHQFSEEYFALMKRAGFNELYIGIESGSAQVLRSMKKHYDRKDIDFCLEQLDKNSIKIRLMLVIGFPTETEEDFQETLNMLIDYKKYSDNGTIVTTNLGKTLSILSGSPLGLHPEIWGVTFNENGQWYSENVTPTERIRRRFRAQVLTEELGYSIEWSKLHLDTMHSMLEGDISNV